MLDIISHAVKLDRVETIKEVSETPAVRLLLIGLTDSEGHYEPYIGSAGHINTGPMLPSGKPREADSAGL